MAHEVKVKHKVFAYYEDTTDPATNREVRVERLARRGETIKVDDATFERGSREDIDAFYSEGEDKEEESGFNAATATLDEVVEWMEEEKPTVQETVDASKGDPSTAKKLLDAENAVSGGDPRTGVTDGLTSVIQRGNE